MSKHARPGRVRVDDILVERSRANCTCGVTEYCARRQPIFYAAVDAKHRGRPAK